MNINWTRIITAVLSTILIGVVLYGSYQFYFNKPEPIINNHYIAMPNSNQTITQPTTKEKNKIQKFLGVFGSKNSIGAVGGFIW